MQIAYWGGGKTNQAPPTAKAILAWLLVEQCDPVLESSGNTLLKTKGPRLWQSSFLVEVLLGVGYYFDYKMTEKDSPLFGLIWRPDVRDGAPNLSAEFDRNFRDAGVVGEFVYGIQDMLGHQFVHSQLLSRIPFFDRRTPPADDICQVNAPSSSLSQ